MKDRSWWILLSKIATRVSKRDAWLTRDFCTGHDLRFTLSALGREDCKNPLIEYGSVAISKGLTLIVQHKQVLAKIIRAL